MCNVWRTGKTNSLTVDDACKKIDEIADAGVVFLNITGGEPFMYSGLEKVLAKAKEHNLHTSVNSNGTLIKNTIDDVAEYLDFLSLSLDSTVAKEHDLIRGVQGCFEKTLEGIKEAVKHVRTGVKMTISTRNIDQMEDMAKLTTKLGARLYMTPVSVIPTEGLERSKSPQLQDIKKEYVANIRHLKKKYPNIKTADAFIDFLEKKGFDSLQCKADTMMINIKPDGKFVSPCGYHPINRYDTVKGAMRNDSGSYGFCQGCHLSCFFLPSAAATVRNIPSLMKSYI
jgi:MoaA/NifB/PqqE/SkfB family radical SAM enzyme